LRFKNGRVDTGGRQAETEERGNRKKKKVWFPNKTFTPAP